MRYKIQHRTVYDYDQDVSLSHHLMRLTPRVLPHQRPLEYTIATAPEPATQSPHVDHFGNTATFLTVEGPHRRLELRSEAIVDISPPSPLPPQPSPAWETIRDAVAPGAPPIAVEPVDFIFASPMVPRRTEFADYAQVSFTPERPLLEAVLELSSRIHADFAFDASATTVGTPVFEFFKAKRGVCQDFAHFMLACLRSIRLPARYVSGYLETLPPPGQPRLAGADASHAWISVWCGIPTGWIDVDPTNNLIPSGRHFTLAWGRDFSDVSPVRGVIVGSGTHQLSVSVDVVPLDPAPVA